MEEKLRSLENEKEGAKVKEEIGKKSAMTMFN